MPVAAGLGRCDGHDHHMAGVLGNFVITPRAAISLVRLVWLDPAHLERSLAAPVAHCGGCEVPGVGLASEVAIALRGNGSAPGACPPSCQGEPKPEAARPRRSRRQP